MYCNVNFVCIETIVLASNNLNKLEEIQVLLGSQFSVIPQNVFDISPIEETGVNFEENALLKAKSVYDIIGRPVIADDSGLEVSVLDNQPGIYSRRFAGNNATDDDNIEKLLRKIISENILNEHTIIVIEISKKSEVCIPKDLMIFDERIYGKTKILFLKKL